MASTEEERRAVRRSWITTVVRDQGSADAADLEFWLSLSAEERIELVSRLSLEAYRRSVGDPDARPQLQRSALRISRP